MRERTRGMVPLVVIFALLALSTLSVASGEFERRYGGSNLDMFMSVQQTEDGGYVAAGGTFSLGFSGGDVWVVKTNGDGDTLWTRFYGGDSLDDAKCIRQTSDGGYVFVGETVSYGHGSADVWLVRIDGFGNVLWDSTYGGFDGDSGYWVEQTTDGGFIIAAQTSNYMPPGGNNVWLIKTDSVGRRSWARVFGGDGVDRGYFVQQTPESGYIICGVMGQSAPDTTDVYVIKTDSLGNPAWQRHYGGADYDAGTTVIRTRAGDYLVAGGTAGSNPGSRDALLLCLNAAGDSLWAKTYSGAPTLRGSCVAQTPDGGFVLAFTTDPVGPDSGDVCLLKTDSLGTVVWERTFGRNGSDGGGALDVTGDSGYVVAGVLATADASWEGYLVKTDTQGVVTDVIMASSPSIRGMFLAPVSPNPLNPTASVRFDLSEPQDVVLEVYDTSGRRIAELVRSRHGPGESVVLWDGRDQHGRAIPSGIYFARLQAGDFTATRKMVLVR
ncbi:MAG: T9SS type A sorting domain-containing protein [Candidatus Eisenbacteria bacterium]